MMTNSFDVIPYPGNPKILFVGLGASSHTHTWVELLSDAEFNIRLFSVPRGGVPPAHWKFATYICEPSQQLPRGLDPNIHRSFHPLPEEIDRFQKEMDRFQKEMDRFQEKLQERYQKIRRNPLYWFFLFMKKVLDGVGSRLGMPALYYDYSLFRDLHPPDPISIKDDQEDKCSSPSEWLAKIIQDWQPDIIHTLGIFDDQGGLFYYGVRKQFGVEGIGKWVLQLRGGSDLALRQFHPETVKQIREMFNECDEIITDNYVNINYIQQLGFAHKVASIAPVAGTGGVDTDIEIDDIILPSKRERIILWPKAYESWWSKALPVLEAIRLAWEDIQPCQIYMTASTPETEAWFLTILPQEVKESCTIVNRLPRKDLLDLMKRARVLLIPSLVDGVPNSLYEAMSHGVFPIVSPLGSITPIVENISNVLFARNLYPTELSEALVKAMSDDLLVDNAAKNNLNLVKQIASREKIAKQLVEYYQHLSSENKQ
jgi:glycosyltransferase involved in cell wall biosynthesis